MNESTLTTPSTSNLSLSEENTTSLFQNATASPDRPADSSTEIIFTLTTVFFSFIIASGVIGNVFVITTLARWRDMRTPCNFLIANISVADLCVCLIAAPLRIIEVYCGWPFGKVLCFIVSPLQDVFVCVSVVTHTIVALERHRVIVTPLKPKLPRAKVKLAIMMTWIATYAACAVPEIIYLKYEWYATSFYCYLKFPTQAVYRIAYEMYLVVFFIVAPLLIQGTAYIRIIKVLRRKDEMQARCAGSFDANSSQRKTFRIRVAQKKRLVKMLLLSMAMFQVCYLPRGIIMLIREFSPLVTQTLSFWYADVSLLALYYIKHILNPAILWAMSKDFQSAFLAICTCNEGYVTEAESGSSKTKTWTIGSKSKKYRFNDAR